MKVDYALEAKKVLDKVKDSFTGAAYLTSEEHYFLKCSPDWVMHSQYFPDLVPAAFQVGNWRDYYVGTYGNICVFEREAR